MFYVLIYCTLLISPALVVPLYESFPVVRTSLSSFPTAFLRRQWHWILVECLLKDLAGSEHTLDRLSGIDRNKQSWKRPRVWSTKCCVEQSWCPRCKCCFVSKCYCLLCRHTNYNTWLKDNNFSALGRWPNGLASQRKFVKPELAYGFAKGGQTDSQVVSKVVKSRKKS